MKSCSVDDCSNKYFSKGFCGKHYTRNRKYGDPLVTSRSRDGRWHHPLYNKYKCMKQRCYSPNDPAYKNWGGRGIGIYQGWLDPISGFWEFAEYIESLEKPSTSYNSIDRIDNDGNYEPGNLRWADAKIQANNTRNKK